MFFLDDVVSEVDVVSKVEKINVEFVGVGSVVDEEVGFGGREDRGSSWRSTSVACVREGAGGVAHLIDPNRWGEIFKKDIGVIGLMGLYVVALDCERETGFDL